MAGRRPSKRYSSALFRCQLVWLLNELKVIDQDTEEVRMHDIIVDNDLNAMGTSFHNVTITVNPLKLLKFLGKDYVSDDYKISREWICEFNGNVFTVYDWKETSLYDERLPSPDAFWSGSEVELHVGSHLGAPYEHEFVDALMAELNA